MDRKSRHSRKHTRNRTALPVPDEVAYVGASRRTVAGETRKVPKIVLRGEWLKALGFPIGAPIYLFAEANGRMVIYRMGLGRPRWLRIVAPNPPG